MSMVSATLGSTTSTFSKRRDSAASFSKMPRYSVKVVAPMHLSWPLESAGLSRLEASSVPPEAAPAPISVWISSMNKMALGLSLSDLSTPLRRCSKSPRYLVPASKAPMSSEYTTASARISGMSFCVMRQARRSAMAVLPTPASPTSSGLLLRRRHRICIVRSTSSWRPINGSIRPSLAAWFRFWVNCSSGEAFSLLRSTATFSSPSAGLSDLTGSGGSPFFMPWAMKLTTTKPVTPFAFSRAVRLDRLGRLAFFDAVGNEVDHIQAGDALLVQVVHGVRILLAEDGHEHIRAGDLFLAIARGLHMHDRALDHALKAQGGLGVDLVGAGHLGRVVLDEVGQRCAQVIDVGRAGAQHLGGAGVVEQCQQTTLDGDELVELLTGLDEGHVQADFQFLGNHVNSFVACLVKG